MTAGLLIDDLLGPHDGPYGKQAAVRRRARCIYCGHEALGSTPLKASRILNGHVQREHRDLTQRRRRG